MRRVSSIFKIDPFNIAIWSNWIPLCIPSLFYFDKWKQAWINLKIIFPAIVLICKFAFTVYVVINNDCSIFNIIVNIISTTSKDAVFYKARKHWCTNVAAIHTIILTRGIRNMLRWRNKESVGIAGPQDALWRISLVSMSQTGCGERHITFIRNIRPIAKQQFRKVIVGCLWQNILDYAIKINNTTSRSSFTWEDTGIWEDPVKFCTVHIIIIVTDVLTSFTRLCSGR